MAFKQTFILSVLSLCVVSCSGDLPHPPQKQSPELTKKLEMKEKLEEGRVEVEKFTNGEGLIRYRIKEDGVTCYTIAMTDSLTCLRDAVPKPPSHPVAPDEVIDAFSTSKDMDNKEQKKDINNK